MSKQQKAKPVLKKEELEKIAAELKKKLSKASISAKQSLSPTNIRTNSSPLKSYFTPAKNYSPSTKSPTKLTNTYNEESPTKKRKTSPLKGPQMVLEPLRPTTPTKPSPTLKPSLETTPTLPKMELEEVVKTPRSYNDEREEGADLLMYLATSPSPAKYTPRQLKFAAPVTPKRHLQNTSKTPNRLTPGFNFLSNGMPSQGLTLTPTGFNMNDYVNFFTPSPGGELLQKNLLKTPDFNNIMKNHESRNNDQNND